MAVGGLNAKFDNLTMMTIDRWMETNWADAFSTHHPLLLRIFDKGNYVKGGTGYNWNTPLYYPVATGPQVQGVTEAFNDLPEATETGGTTMASYKPAQFAMKFGVREYDLDAQGSLTEKLNLVQKEMMIENTKFNEAYQAMLWAAEGAAGSGGEAQNVLGSIRTYVNGGGANTTDGGAQPSRNAPTWPGGGVLTAVGTTPLTKVGGIERNQSGGAYVVPQLFNPGTAAPPSVRLLNGLFTSAERGKDKPDLVILGNALYDYYLSTLQGQITPANETTMGKVFGAFQWRNADVVHDAGMPDTSTVGQIFCLNTDYFQLGYNQKRPEVRAVNEPRKLLKSWIASHTLQLMCNHLGFVHSRHAKVDLSTL
jgi:hypothetical protein